jgi:TonB-linked SusC/RagA family outer membrane protein
MVFMKKITLILFLLSFCIVQVNAQTRKLSGTVTTAEDGQTFPGVSVFVKGTTIGASTDLDGKYSINVPADAKILVFSFVGYETQEIPITTDVINVVMKVATEFLDEVVVTGYAPRSRESITGAVQIVDAKKLEQVPIASFDQILQGQAPGVSVIAASGRPGQSATVNIRGVGSLEAGTQPLYIIDGVPVGSYDLSTLNPNDIENVAVLKDAASVAIYGSRGANGVIQITTKRGKSNERSTITYRGQYGNASNANDRIEMMNSKQKVDYELDLTQKGYVNLRPQGGMTDNEYNSMLDSLRGIDTDWKDVFFRTAKVQSHEVSTRGGTEKTNYFVSGGYYQQEGTLERSEFQRWSSRVNLDHKVNDYIAIGTNAFVGYETNSLTVESRANIWDPVFASLLLNPYEQPYNKDGNFIEDFETYTWGNPLQQLMLNRSDNNQYKIIGNLFTEITPYKDLILKVSAGMDFYDWMSNRYYHPDSYWGNTGDMTNGGASKSFERGQVTTITNTLRYKIPLPEVHSLNILFGNEIIQSRSESMYAEGTRFGHEALTTLNSTTQPVDVGGSIWEHSYLSYFSTANYGLMRKYYVDLSIRRDGSSRFGDDVKWANFWSIGTSWNMKSEAFLVNVDFLSSLRLRLSYGTTGNSSIGDYLWKGVYGFGGSYGNMPISAPSIPNNPDLTWEQSSILNFGFDFGLISRFNGTVDIYSKETYDMLFPVPLSYTSGFGSGWQNICKMINRGIEFQLEGDVVRAGGFIWNLNFNVAYNHNEITELYFGETEYEYDSYILKVGYPAHAFYVTEYAGANPANGKSLWYDKYGNLVDYYSDDNRQVSNKSMYAPVNGGLTTSFSYKDVSFSAFFAFIQGKYMISNTRYFLESNGIFAQYNQTTKMLDYWKEPGHLTEVPIPESVSEFDSRLLEDASFMRLRNLTLAYNVPAKFINKYHIGSIRVFAQGQNLFTLTKYQGYDPEYPGIYELNNYPMFKTITFGIDIGL